MKIHLIFVLPSTQEIKGQADAICSDRGDIAHKLPSIDASSTRVELILDQSVVLRLCPDLSWCTQMTEGDSIYIQGDIVNIYHDNTLTPYYKIAITADRQHAWHSNLCMQQIVAYDPFTGCNMLYQYPLWCNTLRESVFLRIVDDLTPLGMDGTIPSDDIGS